MHSPVYPDTDLIPKEIEPGLSVFTCPKSGGVWIPLQSYLAWQQHGKDGQPVASTGYAPLPADDSKRGALICPESGRLLIRYKVGHGLNFHIDLSPVTGGVWLDKGEWEALKSKGLHVQLNHVFTASYQRQVRSEEYDDSVEKTFRERIGAVDFGKVEAFKTWLANYPKQRDVICYLLHHFGEKKETK